MEIYQLRSFLAVAEAGNITRAAKQINITQPALSQQIINLEKEFDQRLFHRFARKAVLTEAGHQFLNWAQRILLEVDNAAKSMHDHPGRDRLVTVGCIPSVAPYVLPALIAQARIEHPHLQINVHEDFRGSLIRSTVEGRLDLAIVSNPVDEPSLAKELLLREPLLLVVGKSHPLARKKKIRTGDLDGETFVMLGSANSLTERVRDFCGDHKIKPSIGFHCAQIATVKSLVTLNAGIAILPRIAQSSKDHETLSYLHLEDSKPERELLIIRHLQRFQSLGATQFLTMLKAGVMHVRG